MKLSDFDYFLPDELIAQVPAPRRDQSRLLHLPRTAGGFSDHRFDALPDLLQQAGIRLLVLNDTKVIPARLFGTKETGGRVEFLLIAPDADQGIWIALGKSSKPLKPQASVRLNRNHRVTIREVLPEGHYRIDFGSPEAARAAMDEVGVAPLPPYIHRDSAVEDQVRIQDRERYQTIYARQSGAIAAPTAGLHFSPEIFSRLDEMGIERVMLTLHVGLGTFLPVRTENLDDHVMHEEWFEIGSRQAERINQALDQNEPILAVGTTSCRALESAVDATGRIRPGPAKTRLFIKPGYRFHTLTGLLTNFHLPQSTLLMLVSALAGRERILEAYNHAVKTGYRFFSYGDAMLIL